MWWLCARLIAGGGPSDVGPQFVQPTIFTDVDNAMRIAQEEVFGPVLSIIGFDDEDEAVRIGNDVIYGLAAGVWTQNMGRAHRMVKALKAGGSFFTSKLLTSHRSVLQCSSAFLL